MKIARPLLLLSAALALVLPGAGALARVGIASVVEGEPKGLPPGGVQRILRVGIDMSADEKVTTNAQDRAHLVFLDGTSLTVGPNSEVVIDKYVYDPQKKTGEMALKVQRGTLRFVGGVISKTSEVKVDTPSASMGIRGGIFTVAVTTLGATTVNFLFGVSFTITSQGVTETTTQPGTRIIVTPGSPPTPPSPIPPGSLQNNLASFAGGGAGNQGGAIGVALTNAGVGKLNSGLPPSVVIANTPTHPQIVTILTGGTQFAGDSQPGSQPQGSQPQDGNQQQLAGSQKTGPLGGGGPPQDDPPLQDGNPLQGGPLQGASPFRGDSPLDGARPIQGAGLLPSNGPLEGADALQGPGPFQGDTPIIAATPTGVGGPIAGGDGPTGPPVQLASLPPNVPALPPVLPRDPLDPVPSSGLPTAGPPGNPPPPPPDDPPGPPPQQTTDCVTCGFISPPPPTNPPPANNIVGFSSPPPVNNIVPCANVTCN